MRSLLTLLTYRTIRFMVGVYVNTIQMAPTVSGARTSSRMLLGGQLQACRTALAEVCGDEFSA